MCLRAGGVPMKLKAMVRALRDATKAEAAALINRDGAVVAADLPASVSPETFSIMCAAILGAGMTASMELKHRAPHRVFLESEDATILIQEVGRRAMLVLVIPPGQPPGHLEGVVRRFAEAAAKELE